MVGVSTLADVLPGLPASVTFVSCYIRDTEYSLLHAQSPFTEQKLAFALLRNVRSLQLRSVGREMMPTQVLQAGDDDDLCSSKHCHRFSKT